MAPRRTLLLLIVCHTVCLLNDLLINHVPVLLFFFPASLEIQSELLVTLTSASAIAGLRLPPNFACLRDNILQMYFSVSPKRTFSWGSAYKNRF